MVARDEGIHISSVGNKKTDNWDDAWDSDGDDSNEQDDEPIQTKNRAFEEEERHMSPASSPTAGLALGTDDHQDQEDVDDAWGWGDDDPPEIDPVDEIPSNLAAHSSPKAEVKKPLETRQVTLSETYHISSMPQPVLKIIRSILDDGAQLTFQEYVIKYQIIEVLADTA